MAFGIYVHIPFCVQKCTYCDFATAEVGTTFSFSEYTELLITEIKSRRDFIHPQKLSTLYFGGGTPSVLPLTDLRQVFECLSAEGFSWDQDTEITLEINPATITPESLKFYLSLGVNRFSVGAQTFNDRLLQMVKRKHSAAQTIKTLEMLAENNLNFNFDLLFALPTQTLEELEQDLQKTVLTTAKHISPYCLTVPEGHPLSHNRPSEDHQLGMFEMISQSLQSHGFQEYEISNFSKPGFASRHNLLYWTDQEYWGIGLSAHSYIKASAWGQRFWNHSNWKEYAKQIRENSANKNVQQQETLDLSQALTDFHHTRLRLSEGFSEKMWLEKFPAPMWPAVQDRLRGLEKKSWVEKTPEDSWKLTKMGKYVSNQAFLDLTFLKEDIILAYD